MLCLVYFFPCFPQSTEIWKATLVALLWQLPKVPIHRKKKTIVYLPWTHWLSFFFLSLHYLKKKMFGEKVDEDVACGGRERVPREWLLAAETGKTREREREREREKGVGRGRGGRGGRILSVLCHMGPFLLFCIFRLAKIEKNMAEMPAKIAAWRQEKIDLKEKERLRKERRANLANEWLKKQTEAADKKKGQRWRQWTLHWWKAFFSFTLCSEHCVRFLAVWRQGMRLLLYSFRESAVWICKIIFHGKKKKKKRPSHSPTVCVRVLLIWHTHLEWCNPCKFFVLVVTKTKQYWWPTYGGPNEVHFWLWFYFLLGGTAQLQTFVSGWFRKSQFSAVCKTGRWSTKLHWEGKKKYSTLSLVWSLLRFTKILCTQKLVVLQLPSASSFYLSRLCYSQIIYLFLSLRPFVCTLNALFAFIPLIRSFTLPTLWVYPVQFDLIWDDALLSSWKWFVLVLMWGLNTLHTQHGDRPESITS